ncbi:hypothetical protein GJ744_012376 [Endocarpon pusillum]|uniref:Uncharacterized protein n=1 Tax=Endocarpon pusillum TaxID=364733 RepID=A0A8H7AD91_9EURO|nr:hypothetical protein GJ744_012376 [Endocarpon pusillum]
MVTSTTSTTPTTEVGANGTNGFADPDKKSHHSHSFSEAATRTTSSTIPRSNLEQGHEERRIEGFASIQNGFALMISWESEHDDLHVKQEVDTLSAILRDTFGYKIIPALLGCNSKRAQAQANHLVAEFVWRHDGPNNLLIVYFAGPPRGCPRAFEYLAATSSGETTRKPGKHSFTTALIWALRTLCEERGQFITTDLLNTIKKRAPDFPKDQSPVLSDRNRGSPRERIFLQPLQKNGTESRPEVAQTYPRRATLWASTPAR